MRPDRTLTAAAPTLRTSSCRRLAARGGVVALAAVLGQAAHAQNVDTPTLETEAAVASVPKRTFSIVPTLSASETFTDNSRLSDSDKRADAITEIRPGLRISSNGGRVKGYLDYELSGLLYANGTQGNQLQNSLKAFANVEGIENTAFLDVNANISQQSISAFGTQSADSSVGNTNRTEVRNLSLSPYFTGKVMGDTSYEARWTQTLSRSSGDSSSNNDVSRGRIGFDGPSSFTVLNWSADATHEAINYEEGRRTTDDIVRGLLHFSVDPELRLTAIMGRESNDYVSLDKETHNTPGWGVDWNPSERTHLSLQRERRFFGDSHNYSFSHRMPSSVVSYTDTRDITTNFGQSSGGANQGTAYQQFFTLLASQIPDPAQRNVAVNNLLQTLGIPPNSQAFAGSQASAAMLQRRQELSIGFLGTRSSLSFVASRSQANRLDALSQVVDDFSDNSLVKQNGFALILSHRLTELSTLNLLGSIDRTTGSLAEQSTRLRTITLDWSTKLGPHVGAGLGLRHAVFDSPLSPYIESAVIASLNLQF